MSDLREKIMKINDIKSEIVDVSEYWDCKIEICTMTSKERAKLLALAVDDNGETNNEIFQAAIVVFTAKNPETGDKLFQLEDIDWLINKASKPIDMLSKVGMQLSGFTKQQVDDIEKN